MKSLAKYLVFMFEKDLMLILSRPIFGLVEYTETVRVTSILDGHLVRLSSIKFQLRGPDQPDNNVSAWLRLISIMLENRLLLLVRQAGQLSSILSWDTARG